MKTRYTKFASLLVCGLAFGCSKPAEPPKPEPTKPVPPPAASASAPILTAPTLPPGPVLPPPVLNAPSPTGSPSAATPTAVPGFAKRPAADDLKAVQDVIAKQMKIKPEDVKPTATLAELKMSALDYPDAIQSLEEKLNITISKVSLQKISGADMPYDVIEKLTVQKLADAINAIPPKAP